MTLHKKTAGKGCLFNLFHGSCHMQRFPLIGCGRTRPVKLSAFIGEDFEQVVVGALGGGDGEALEGRVDVLHVGSY